MAGDTVQTEAPAGPTQASGGRGSLAARLDGIDRAGLGRLAGAALAPLIGAIATLWLVIPTLAPGVLSEAAGDSAEFQTVSWVLGTAHPTGYPSYVILGFIASHLLPFGDPAYRMNLLQALVAAGAVAGTIAIVQLLTGMRWIALATGLLLLVMPAFSSVSVYYIGQSSPVFWRLSTYADPHLLHLALAALIFLLLLTWERRRRSVDPETKSRADRWLVAAACVFGVALANHSLTLMLAPGIALFVVLTAPRILLQWRLILTSAVVLAATAALLWLELPIRAAMHAPLVYGHPDTWNGFLYVITGQQFGGIPPGIGDNLDVKYAAVMSLLSGWLGPLGYVAMMGLGTSIVRRPRYVLLSVLGAVLTSGFAAAYANSDLERYYLVPVFVAFTFVGLAIADAVSIAVWLVDAARLRFAERPSHAEIESIGTDDEIGEPVRSGRRSWQAQALLAVETVVAVSLIVGCIAVVPERQSVQSAIHPGGVSHTLQSDRETWVRAVLAPPDQGGIPANSVIVSNWSDSTTLWYGQLVEGLRPDVYVVDDRTRLDQNLGEVWDVIDSYLGRRPVFLLRFPWYCDGMETLSQFYQMTDFQLAHGYTITEVTGRTGPVVCP